MGAVGKDAADLRRSHENSVWTDARHPSLDILLAPQIY
jgi:hypothetical protein